MSNTKLIMIIDDEEVIRDVLCTFLENKGYQTVALKNGQSAVKFTETIKPDVVLLDIKMPGIDGIETCGKLKQALKSSPRTGIIIITGYGTPENVEESFNKGAIDVIKKPFDLNDVHLRIQAWLEVRNSVSEETKTDEYKRKLDEINC